MNTDIIVLLIVSVVFCVSMIVVYWFGVDLFVDFCKECNEERESKNAALADSNQSETKSDDEQDSLTIPKPETLNTIKCEYCGSRVPLTETNCPNCGAVINRHELDFHELDFGVPLNVVGRTQGGKLYYGEWTEIYKSLHTINTDCALRQLMK